MKILPHLSSYFPAPRLMAMRHVGIHVSSDRMVTAIELVSEGEYLVPRMYERLPFDAEGSDLMEKLKILRKKHGIEFASFTVAESESYLFESDIPTERGKVDDSHIRDAIAFTIEEKAPVKLTEVLFDYSVMREKPGELAAAVAVVPEASIAKYIELCRGAGIVPTGFKVEAQAVADAVIPQGSLENIIVVTLKRSKVEIALVCGRGVFVSATLESPEKFDKEVLCGQINKYYIFWLTHKANQGESAEKLGRVIVVGERACDPGLTEFLSTRLKVKVEAGNVWVNCLDLEKRVPAISQEESFAYAEAIGLLIQ